MGTGRLEGEDAPPTRGEGAAAPGSADETNRPAGRRPICRGSDCAEPSDLAMVAADRDEEP